MNLDTYIPEDWRRDTHWENKSDKYYCVFRYKDEDPAVVVYRRDRYGDWLVKEAVCGPMMDERSKYGEFENRNEALLAAQELMESLEFDRAERPLWKPASVVASSLLGLLIMMYQPQYGALGLLLVVIAPFIGNRWLKDKVEYSFEVSDDGE